MHEIGIDDLQQLVKDGRRAARYAWEHYEELAAREHTYVLYGPYTWGIGASVPSNSVIPSKYRKLTHSTRRKRYTVYYLDGEYNVLRTIKIINYTQVESVYYHFELDGTVYAYPFDFGEKKTFTDTRDTSALRFENGRIVFFGRLSLNSAFVKFYEYTETEKVIVTTYQYTPKARLSMHGYPVDPDAPVGALNSSVLRYCTEEISGYIEFSHWFE